MLWYLSLTRESYIFQCKDETGFSLFSKVQSSVVRRRAVMVKKRTFFICFGIC